ncbi:MAG: ribonuclease P protein component [Bacteroidales bacterium]|nr:ribonuclease P protein component [Bacteroidales bacterium]
MDAGLPKQERICGKIAIGKLLAEGRYGYAGALKFCWLAPNGTGNPDTGSAPVSRVMVSVSKRFFKRAVKRNLLKRRLREAYRTQKGLLPAGVDLMLIYNTKDVLPFEEIHALVGRALVEIAGKIVTAPEEG